MQSESKYFICTEENEEFNNLRLKDSSYLPQILQWDQEKLTKTKRMYPFEKLDYFHEFKVREDDIWIVTNDRCGTTWTQEMTWLILNNLDFDQARSVPLETRSPFLEQCLNSRLPTPSNFNFESVPSPRLIKCHLPMQLLPKEIWTKKPKIIYVVRDPRDAFVSSFYLTKLFMGVNSSLSLDMEDYIEKLIKFSCFWNHVLGFYKLRKQENILFYSYEQMKKDLKSVVLRVCNFVGINYKDEEIEKLLEHLDFKNMKDSESCSHKLEIEQVHKNLQLKDEDIDPSMKFIRKGKVGGHRSELSPEILKKFNIWENEQLEKYGLTLKDILFSNV
uniref:Sulfotransferase domain-containing protein n=1 Tax=Megaselia scalaris TaxID=36166 RepID=T1GG42_MEGSC